MMRQRGASGTASASATLTTNAAQRHDTEDGMMMEAIGHTADGTPTMFQGHTTSELESTAERLGCVRYTYAVDGGRETVIRLGAEWVIL